MKQLGMWSLAALSVVACSDANSPSGPTRLAPYVESNGDLTAQVVPGEYIVVLNDNVGDVMGAAVTSGAEVMATWDKALRGYAVRATPEQLRAIRADARVKFVEPNGRVHISATQTPTPSWGLDRIDQLNLPLNNSFTYPSTAAGVHVYTIDTGILLTHTDFAGRMSAGAQNFDAVTPGGTANDCNGHGTHVSGTIGGTTYGIAKGVTFHAVRVLDCGGSGTNAQVISGINWVAANKIQPAVANMSLGGGFNLALNNASDALVNAGVVLAVASGNSSADACNFSPASAPLPLTVNATTITDARSGFSNFGTCTDLFAPGSNIVSDYIGSNTATATLSGTSMASPHVAGAAALYRAANPTHTPAQVNAAIIAGATPNKVTNPGVGSPNLLLNIQFIGGGGGGNQAPVADFTITCTAGVSCVANASPSTDDAGFGNLTFAWANNVARPAKTGNPATYNFNASNPSKNSFNLTLTATDAGGLSHSVTKAVVIPAGGGNQAPVADFTISCTAGVSCVLNSTSTDDGGPGNLTYLWTNNVGRPNKTANPATYNYNSTTPAKNTFNATLTVTDAGGLTSSITKAVVIP